MKPLLGDPGMAVSSTCGPATPGHPPARGKWERRGRARKKRLKWCQRSSSSSGVKSRHDVGVNISRVGSNSESVRMSSSSSSSLGEVNLVVSSGVPGGRRTEDRKKTGSRRRNVLKEDLVAEETKTSGEHEIGNTHTHRILLLLLLCAI